MKLIKQVSTNFLRLVILLLGVIVLALCIFALPSMWRVGFAEFPMASNSILMIVIGLYITAVPFFVALWQAIKLLGYIDKNTAFSDRSVQALKNIKYCAMIISAVYVVFVPLLFPIADADDAPGLIIMGAVIACAPITVAVFAAVLQKLLQSVIEIKSENDLTV